MWWTSLFLRVRRAGLAGQFFKRAISILEENEIKYNEKVVAELINNHFPDWRRILNELQRYSVSGEIDAGILVNLGEKNIKDLMGMMKKKEFTNVRKWVVENIDNDPDTLFRVLCMIIFTIIWTLLLSLMWLSYWVSTNIKMRLLQTQKLIWWRV